MNQKKTVGTPTKSYKGLLILVWLAAGVFVVLTGLLGGALSRIGTENLISVEGRLTSIRKSGDEYFLELEESPGRTFTLNDYCCEADLTATLGEGERVVLEVSEAQWEKGSARLAFYSVTRAGEVLVSSEEVQSAQRLDGMLSVTVVGIFSLLILVAAIILTWWQSRISPNRVQSAVDVCIGQPMQSFYLWYLGKNREFQKKRKHFILTGGLSLGIIFLLFIISVPLLAGLLGDLNPLFIGGALGGALLLLVLCFVFLLKAARYWKKNATLFVREFRDYLEHGTKPDVDFLLGQTAENEEPISLDLAECREVRFGEGKLLVRLPDLELGEMNEAEDLLPGLPSAEHAGVFEGLTGEDSEEFRQPGREVEIPFEDLHFFVRCRYFSGDIPVAIFVCSDLPEGLLSTDLVFQLTHGFYRNLKENGVKVRGLENLLNTLEKRIARFSPRAFVHRSVID